MNFETEVGHDKAPAEEPAAAETAPAEAAPVLIAAKKEPGPAAKMKMA